MLREESPVFSVYHLWVIGSHDIKEIAFFLIKFIIDLNDFVFVIDGDTGVS